MALIPDRAVNLTASSATLAACMQAYYEDIGNSAWSAVHDIGVAKNNTAVNLTFADANPDTILSASENWVTLGLSPGDSIDVRGSTSNDGRYLINSITTTSSTNDTLVLDAGESLTAEGPASGITVSKVGEGGFSWAIRNAANTMELNYLNTGTIDTPGTGCRLGINPDGQSDPIVKSDDPYDSGSGPANFSGQDNGKLLSSTIGNTQFIALEWPDALAIIFKDAARTYAPSGFFWGKLLHNPISAQESVGDIRLDGHAILDYRPTGVTGWPTTGMRRRHSVGTLHGIGLPSTVAWSDYATLATSYGSTTINRWQFGTQSPPNNEEIIQPVFAGAGGNGAERWFHKYLRFTGDLELPFTTVPVGSTQRYMHLHTSAANHYLLIPVPSSFTPNP